MSERLSTAEASQLTNIPEPTIKNWLGKLPIPAEKDSAGRWRFGSEALDVLRAIKELREEDRTFETIRRRIGEPEMSGDSSGVGASSSGANDQSSIDERPLAMDERSLAESLAGVITPQLVEALRANNDLAEKYAHAAHRIGRLEAELEAAQAQLAEARQKIVLLEAPKEGAPQRPWWKLWG